MDTSLRWTWGQGSGSPPHSSWIFLFWGNVGGDLQATNAARASTPILYLYQHTATWNHYFGSSTLAFRENRYKSLLFQISLPSQISHYSSDKVPLHSPVRCENLISHFASFNFSKWRWASFPHWCIECLPNTIITSSSHLPPLLFSASFLHWSKVSCPRSQPW